MFCLKWQCWQGERVWAWACGSEGVACSDLPKVDMDGLRGDFSCRSSLCFVDINCLSDTQFANSFSHLVGCLFICSLLLSLHRNFLVWCSPVYWFLLLLLMLDSSQSTLSNNQFSLLLGVRCLHNGHILGMENLIRGQSRVRKLMSLL